MSAPAASRGRYHHGALHDALLAEAVRQVRERGVEQVSLRGLAQQVGVSPSAAYQHFPDKAALLRAVGLWSFDELARWMRAGVERVHADGDAGSVARFAAIGRAYAEFAVGEPHLFRHMFGPLLAPDGGPGRPDCDPDELSSMGSSHEMLLDALTDLSDRGLLRPGLFTPGTARLPMVFPQPGGDGPDSPPPVVDLLAWTLVHGFSSLVVEGHLPAQAGLPLLMTMGRLVLRDEVLLEPAVQQAMAQVLAP